MRRRRIGSVQVAALLASLLLSAGLVIRISTTLSPVAPETRQSTAAGRAIQLRDTANGVTLFDDVTLAPGDSDARCVTVSATGTRAPDEVRMLITDTYDEGIGPWLHLDVTQGTGKGPGASCAGFTPTREVLRGDADEVVGELADGMPWFPEEAEQVPGGHATTYRFTATLLDGAPNEVMGAKLGFDLVWSTQFEATDAGFIASTVAVAVRFTEDSMIPMLAMLSLAILFLGLQDRLDGTTPRLSQAVLSDELVEFHDV